MSRRAGLAALMLMTGFSPGCGSSADSGDSVYESRETAQTAESKVVSPSDNVQRKEKSVAVAEAKSSARAENGEADHLSSEARKITDDFHKLYFGDWDSTFATARWMGVPVLKVPLDLWIYQEIINEIKPDIIIETGTFAGGSAIFLAQVCDLVGHGSIITVDYWNTQQAEAHINEHFPLLADRTDFRPVHPRLRYLHGSSTSDEVRRAIIEAVPTHAKVLVILDSDHTMPHVLEEMNFYHQFVSKDSYLIVEDTNTDNNPVAWYGPGPKQAADKFLETNKDFVVDTSREKFMFTLNPTGFLKRVSSTAGGGA